jgi:hypothetical protein
MYKICIDCKDLGDAAAFEKLAKELKIHFTVVGITEDKKVTLQKGKKSKQRREKNVTWKDVLEFQSIRKDSPRWSNKKVGAQMSCDFSAVTLNRMENGFYYKLKP